MGENARQGQLVGPFAAGEELVDKMKADSISSFDYVSHIGIQTKPGRYVWINREKYEIGTTGIYEIGNTQISSLYFEDDVNKNTIIDYVIEA